ncbi:EscU/YscU/HrcU family type III secretion system export apparatus switch protein [Virgibacillus sp. W0181]|uniref:EscU/YscU/HrcU family type III secretion system export apparatus switch protein n=1 Tax=Virgibacillus sp. W0181 TaxID=3391581 RepID=UPI003F47D75B
MNKYRKKAAALRYDTERNAAPKVVASGKGLIAENILDKAEQNKIPMVEDPSLAELLSELNINETIPEELYQAVAEVFAYVYQLDKTMEVENK